MYSRKHPDWFDRNIVLILLQKLTLNENADNFEQLGYVKMINLI